jgi:2-dehydropantoate 2-reductase
MLDIVKVGVLGAGAMGAYFATQFNRTPGFETFLIAIGARKEKLKRDGIVVNGGSQFIPVIEPQEAIEALDLIIVAVKQHHLPEAVQDLGILVGDSTVFLSIMNGLESEECIGKIYGMEKVLYGISLGIDAVREGNNITYTKPGIHYFGEAKNLTISEKVTRVKEAFEKAGINYKIPDDMLRVLWWKFMFNVGINQASAVMRATYGVFHSNRDAQDLMEALMEEVLALAQAMGVNLIPQDIEDLYPVLNSLSPEGKTSMLQDIEGQRKSEVEAFGGKAIALGKNLGIPTPVNQTVFQIIRVLEYQYL